MFQSNDKLKKHIVEIHENLVKDATQKSLSELKECSLCEDTFSTNEEFDVLTYLNPFICIGIHLTGHGENSSEKN